jgi:hypothetical protein
MLKFSLEILSFDLGMTRIEISLWLCAKLSNGG